MPTVLITAGPTREHLDEVRFLSNASTGRMGYEIARAARDRGHGVVLVSGPTHLRPPDGVEFRAVVSAQEMADEVSRHAGSSELVFAAAAVADARPLRRRAGKPPKGREGEELRLVPTPDVVAEAARAPGRRVVVGFALEALDEGGFEAVLARARAKLERKGLDAIAVNLHDAIGASDSEVVVLEAGGGLQRLPRQAKAVTAERLVELGEELWRRKR